MTKTAHIHCIVYFNELSGVLLPKIGGINRLKKVQKAKSQTVNE